MFKKGQQVLIRPEYQDTGDSGFYWFAIDDEINGGVTISPHIPGMPIPPTYPVKTWMLQP